MAVLTAVACASAGKQKGVASSRVRAVNICHQCKMLCVVCTRSCRDASSREALNSSQTHASCNTWSCHLRPFIPTCE